MTESALEAELAFQLKALGLPEPVREYRFAYRRWRFDFAWPDKMIAVEVEGGTRSGGRHVRPMGFERDAEKYNAAAALGWRVLRFPAKAIKDGSAMNVIEGVLS